MGKTLVAYSLGNLLFDQPYPLDCRQGVILRVTRSVRGGSLAFELLPTVVERGRVRPANPQEAQTILARLRALARQESFTQSRQGAKKSITVQSAFASRPKHFRPNGSAQNRVT